MNEHDVPGRVRVVVRLRPRNGEAMVADANFADCVELQPEKRVYEVVAKPVVEISKALIVRRSKLVIVDLAGLERIHKLGDTPKLKEKLHLSNFLEFQFIVNFNVICFYLNWV
ncbi:hypothetical protein Leryth_026426 [Lithospermum erythrorhizon]|nr:hypothetical protein Leryth_026426 [Lithospermum erythrorhizon]